MAGYKMYHVYVIQSDEGYTYTGQTDDLPRRLSEHNNHQLSFWTKRGNNWKLIHSEEFENRSDAMKREKWLKTGIGREYIKEIIKGSRFNPDRSGLPTAKEK